MTALLDALRPILASEGPITVARYMGLCLGHPAHGYYMTRDPFGTEGDFTTAPEISQMFGELIGLWAAEIWRLMGAPDPVRLVELGPGRGTLMADVLRAARVVPRFLDAADIRLVETSPVLKARQETTLSSTGAPVAWHAHVSDVPAGPAIVLANEFFDALPVRQYVRTERGWCERLVGLAEDGTLAFGLAGEPDRRLPDTGPDGAVLEQPEAALDIAAGLAARLAAQGGAALVIDYGHGASAVGDTLQAVKRHALRRSARGAGRSRPDGACRFRASGRGRRGAAGRRCTDRSRKAISCARSASRRAPGRCGRAPPKPRPSRSTAPSLASPMTRRAGWAACSRPWRSRIRA